MEAAVAAEDQLLLSEESPAFVQPILDAAVDRVGEVARVATALVVLRVRIAALDEERAFDRAVDLQLQEVELPDPRLLDEHERISIAACFVGHAISREPLSSISWASPTSRAIYRLRSRRSYRVANARMSPK